MRGMCQNGKRKEILWDGTKEMIRRIVIVENINMGKIGSIELVS